MCHELKKIEPFDWRYAAAITGLVEYLKWLGDKAPNWSIKEYSLEYDPVYITEQDYLNFVEYKYSSEMHHCIVEELLTERADTEVQIKSVNDKLSANSIMKKIFKQVRYDGKNADKIQMMIDENREEIVRETFRNKNNLYRNYCNTNQLFAEGHDCCRLWGYYVDIPKKGKSLTYNFNLSNLVTTDEQIFDFIPFAFHGEREFFFVNDNINLDNLIYTNSMLAFKIEEEKKKFEGEQKNINARQIFFKLLIETKDFIRNDIEVIVKNIEKDHFETLYLRKYSLEILSNLGIEEFGKRRYECFCTPVRIANEWLDIFQVVINAIINLVLLDNLIDYLLKYGKDGDYAYIIGQLIKINIMIKGEKDMEQATKRAYACAKTVREKRVGDSYKIPNNKLHAYRQKLTSALAFEDYERFNQILLNLANYADETFDFAYDLFEDFEKNKELAYTFVNALYRSEKMNKGE